MDDNFIPTLQSEPITLGVLDDDYEPSTKTEFDAAIQYVNAKTDVRINTISLPGMREAFDAGICLLYTSDAADE